MGYYMSESNGLDMYNVVKYFIENSGMLFFFTKDDVKIAYDRISTIFNVEKKYNHVEVDNELKKLKEYYDFFCNNFDQYFEIEGNRKLFSDIVKYDSNLIYCGNSNHLRKYVENEKKKLNEANKNLSFFQKRKNVKESMNELTSIVRRVEDYRIFYELEVPSNKIDKALDFLGLETFASERDIVEAYNKQINDEYNNLTKGEFNFQILFQRSKYFDYIRDIISGAYVNVNLTKQSLLDKYSLSDEAINSAFAYFNLDPDCEKDEMISSVSAVIDDIRVRSVNGLANSVLVGNRNVYVSNNIMSLTNNLNNNVEELLEVANFYKNVLFNKFGVKESVQVTPVARKVVPVKKKVKSDNISFSTLFNGLDYSEAEKLYYSLMNRLVNSSDDNDLIEAKNLEDYWNSIKNDLGEIKIDNYNGVPRR